MKIDYNLYTVVYLLQLIIPAGIYAISLHYRLSDKIFWYFIKKLNTSRLQKLFAISASCFVLFLPVILSIFVGNFILFSLRYQDSSFPVGSFLGSTALTTGYYSFFAGICLLVSYVIRMPSEARRIAVFCFLCFCTAFLSVSVVKNPSDLMFGYATTEADDNLTERIHKFLSDTNFKEVSVKIVKSEQVNARAGNQGIYIDEGLIKTLNPDEFLTVIAHEVRHLENEDSAFALIPTASAMLLFVATIIVFTRKKIHSGTAFQEKYSGQNVCVILFIFLLCVPLAKIGWTQYKKTNEIRADAEAVKFLIDKNISTKDFETALTKTSRHLTEPTFLTYMLMFDHPTTTERIANIQATEAQIRSDK